MASFRPSLPSFVLILCTVLSILFVVGVKGNSDGAPEASCPDMLPVHTHLGAAVSNVSCGSSCPALEVVGFQGNNTFTYACGRAYTLTSAVMSIMVEAREATNLFNSSTDHVGLFSVDGTTDLHTICQGNAVTQSRILSGAPFNFTWMAPGPGNLKTVRFWYTVVPAPASYFAQLVGPVGEPDPSSCMCRENEFIYRPPGTPDVMTLCLPCPNNSSSVAGTVERCSCLPGTGRISEVLGEVDAMENCTTCPGAAMNPTLTMPTPPNVMLTWSPPATSADWPLRYRVESSDGREIAASLTTPSVVVEGLNHLTQYTVNIITFTNSSTCSNASVTYTFTTGQRCASTPPRFTGSPSISTESVVLVWDEPDIMDPLVLDRRYALYTMCDGETNQILQADDLQGPSLTVTGLPANTRCSALVVMYSRHCDRNLTGPLVGRTTFMTAAGLPSPPASSTAEEPGAIAIEVIDGIVVISITPEMNVDRYVCTYFDPSTPSTSVEVVRQGVEALRSWEIRIPQSGRYSVQCAGINTDGLRGPFSNPFIVDIPLATTTAAPDSGAIPFTTFIAVVVVLAFLLFVAIVCIMFILLAISPCFKKKGKFPISHYSENTYFEPAVPMVAKQEPTTSPLPTTPHHTSPQPPDEEAVLPEKATADTFNVFAANESL